MSFNSNNCEQTFDENNLPKDVLNILPEGNEETPLGSGIIKGLIGKGGMGAVYKIWNQGLEKYHAVKLAFPTNQENYDRFKMEAKIASNLKHTNIVEIKNVGEWKKLPYIEMEFIDGKTLHHHLKEKNSFPPSVVCAIAILITRALNHAHSAEIKIDGKTYKGIIHRDLKPENIMVSKTGQITVMDFGIARPKDSNLKLTKAQSFIGTPQYAAPEQFGFEKVDHRADIYTLGEILFEMLSGVKVISDSVLQTFCENVSDNDPMAELLKYKKEKWPFRPRLDSRLQKIPPRLLKIIDHCLEPDKNKRPETTQDLLDSLEAAFNFFPEHSVEDCTRDFFTEIAPQKTTIRAKRSVFRSPILILITLFILLLTIGTIFFFSKENSSHELTAKDSIATSINSHTSIDTFKYVRVPGNVDSPQTITSNSYQYGVSQDQSHLLTNKSMRKDSVVTKDSMVTVNPKSIAADNKQKAESTTVKGNNKIPAKLATDIKIKQPIAPETKPDPITLALMAIESKNYPLAENHLAMIGDGHPDMNKKNILLITLYLKTGRLVKAQNMISRVDINAAEFYLTTGKVYYEMGNYSKAKRYIDQAQEKPCILSSRQTVVLESLYYSALVAHKIYIEEKSKSNLDAAKNSWESVKRSLSQSTDDYRYKQAIDALSKL